MSAQFELFVDVLSEIAVLHYLLSYLYLVCLY